MRELARITGIVRRILVSPFRFLFFTSFLPRSFWYMLKRVKPAKLREYSLSHQGQGQDHGVTFARTASTLSPSRDSTILPPS